MIWIGWIGAILFSCCGIPQAVKTYQTRSCSDISWGFLGMWLGGEIFTCIYVVWENVLRNFFQIPLLFNYVLNIIIIVYLIFAKVYYKEKP